MAIRNNLKDIRYEHKMNQKQFSNYLNISQPQYSRYERQIDQPSLETVMKISNRINKPVNDIIYLVSEE
jgi:putative transcriptional regulator